MSMFFAFKVYGRQRYHKMINSKIWLLVTVLFAFAFVISCKKETIQIVNQVSLPKDSISTPIVFTIFSKQIDTSILTGGIVLRSGNDSIISRGVCWSKNHNPRLATAKDSLIKDGSNQKQFTSVITTLTPGEVYHVCAYATNAKEVTGYGQEITVRVISAPPAPPTPRVGFILYREPKNDFYLGGQVFGAGQETIVEYDSLAYQSDTSMVATGSSYSAVVAPVSGIYLFTSDIALLAGNLDQPDGLLTHFLTVNGQRYASRAISFLGNINLTVSVHLKQGDTVQTKVLNGSSEEIFCDPSGNFVLFAGYLVKAD